MADFFERSEDTLAEIIQQLSQFGHAEVTLSNGFVLSYNYPNPDNLPWPWDAFYRLVEKYVDGDVLWDVLEMYRVFTLGA